MARYSTTVESRKSPEEVFQYPPDFANAEEWDPAWSKARPWAVLPLATR